MENLNASAQSAYIRQLIEDGIMALEDRAGLRRTYKLTERGEAFLYALLTVPYPKQKWEVQWPRI
jgi:predicted transcriptional regulator